MAQLYTDEQIEAVAARMSQVADSEIDPKLARTIAAAYLALLERWKRIDDAPKILTMEPAPYERLAEVSRKVASEQVGAIDRLTHAVLLVAEANASAVMVQTQVAEIPVEMRKQAQAGLLTFEHRIQALRDRLAESTGMKP